MSAIAPADPSHGGAAPTSSVPKKKANKKKKSAKSKGNGEVAKTAEPEVDEGQGEGEGEVELEEPAVIQPQTPIEQNVPEPETARTNGESSTDATVNGQAEVPTRNRAAEALEDSMASNASDTTDASSRLEAMSQDREALRVEVEQLRKALEDIQEKHSEEIAGVRSELEESESAKEQAQSQYQNLLGRVNTIKSSLGERLAADRAELAEAKEQIEELEAQNESLVASTKSMEAELSKVTDESQASSKELSGLRNRHNLSQQNWLSEREDLLQQTKHLREEAEAAREAMGDWEVLAMEERSIREGLADRVSELEDHLSGHKESYERAVSERDSQSQAVEGLQRALQEIQEARKVELREMVETTQIQLEALNKVVMDAESRATEAETARAELTAELERAAPFEKEVKEKNLLIGKLRHEAIILNDHLAKALRFLKKTKPEDNIDRQIVTNYLLHFLALDRADPKKFESLKLIAQLLKWTDEQKEKAGLARPGASNSSLRLPLSPFHRTPSTPSLSSEFYPDGSPGGVGAKERESLAELWTGFLEQQAEQGSLGGGLGSGRSASVSNARPDTRG